jgi:hypothetical protein
MAVNPPNDPNELSADPSIDRLRNLSAVTRHAAYAPAYSRVVRRLRVVLPVVGVLTVVIVILWPRIRAEFNRPTETGAMSAPTRMGGLIR